MNINSLSTHPYGAAAFQCSDAGCVAADPDGLGPSIQKVQDPIGEGCVIVVHSQASTKLGLVAFIFIY